MLRDVRDMLGFAIEASDGALGHVRDVYFDDDAWVIRYLVVETGDWLANRRVLVSPLSVDEPMWAAKKVRVRLTREQVRASPSIDTDKPVSRQHELSFGGYYGYPSYWGSSGFWGEGDYPSSMYMGAGYSKAVADQEAGPRGRRGMAYRAAERGDADPHLRSCNAVIGYHIHATDGDVGHVQGILVAEKSWAIRYLVINTSNWWLGHQVLVAPEWITAVSWMDRKVVIDLTRQTIRESPHWDPAQLPDRPQETSIYQHYGRLGYWEYEPLSASAPPGDTDRALAHRQQPAAR